MDKINAVIDNEQIRAVEQQLEGGIEQNDLIAPLAPECLVLIGGGSGILMI